MTRWLTTAGSLMLAGACLQISGCTKPANAPEVGSHSDDNRPQPKSPADSATPAATATNASEIADVDATPAEPAWRKDVTLELKTWQETRDLIASFKGRVVVVDIWSTACEPCLREFPNLVDLQGRLPEDVVCIGVNCDYAGVRRKPPEFYRERVTKILNDKAAKIVNVMCTQPADELFVELKIDSIPAVFVYDRDGRLASTFDNRTNKNAEFTYPGDVLPAVERLVGDNTETASAQ